MRILFTRLFVALFFSALALLPAYAQAEKSEKPQGKSQTELAAKNKTFARISSSSDEVKKALPTTNLAEAKKLIGKTGVFVGTVEKVFTPAGNTVVLLNFAKNYKTALIGKIEAEHFAVFPDLTTLKGKKVLLSGKVVDYKGQPEIELTTLDSIRIVE